MANEVNLVDGVGGVGRDNRALPLGTITVTPTSRNAANTASSQPLVANGLAFNKKGDLFNIDTARGALWKWNSTTMETSKVRPGAISHSRPPRCASVMSSSLIRFLKPATASRSTGREMFGWLRMNEMRWPWSPKIEGSSKFFAIPLTYLSRCHLELD
jgi:hypothetical protein